MRWLAGAFGDLTDLVLPAGCAGCAADGQRLRRGVCRRCADALLALRPGPAAPTPAPPGLPPTVSLGGYEGVLREVLLAYKERARHPLAAPLGALLAEAVAAAVEPGAALLLVPVPSTARAARDRNGDHLARLARHAARRLADAGRTVAVVRAARALPRADSAGLNRAERAASAGHGFAVRPAALARLRRSVGSDGARDGTRRAPRATRGGSPARVVVLDDIVTTGATLAAVATVLARAGAPVSAAAVLAATRRRLPVRRSNPAATGRR